MTYQRTVFVVAVLVAILTALAVVGGAHGAATAPYDSELGTEARRALDSNKFAESRVPTKFVYVRCYATERLFEGAYAWRSGQDGRFVWGYAIPRLKTVYLRPSTCRDIHRYMDYLDAGMSDVVTEWQVGAYATLLHEAMHIQGVKDERMAECLANDGIRWAALGLYDVTKGEANRLSRIAFAVSARYTSENYHSVSGQCQQNLANLDWTNFRT